MINLYVKCWISDGAQIAFQATLLLYEQCACW
jgi:hypothetical protein